MNTTTETAPIGDPLTPNRGVCPGCGRCRECGQPAPYPNPVTPPYNPAWPPFGGEPNQWQYPGYPTSPIITY